MKLLQEEPQRGHLDFKVGNSTIVVPLARSINTIVEPKLEPDPIAEILMLTQEEWPNHSLIMNTLFKKKKNW